MKNLILISFLALFSFAAVAQPAYTGRGVVTTSSYPVFDRVYEPSSEVCRDVVVDNGYNAGGAAVGAIVGYVIGRELDRDGRRYSGGYYGGRGYDQYRGGYYNDRRGGYHGGYHESRVGRYGGAVTGAVIGGYTGRGGVRRVCEPQGNGYYREVLVGYRIVSRYPNGTTREYFEPNR